MTSDEIDTTTSVKVFEFLCQVYDAKDFGDGEQAAGDAAVAEYAQRHGLITIHNVKGQNGHKHESYSVTPKGISWIERQKRRAAWLSGSGN